ncbi:MAG: DUF4976 domain-containing protein, partial [Gemmatimonadetes bacterium]|nr:DUF4976 domain-containing protein [Gemmatimonadota bacterium]
LYPTLLEMAGLALRPGQHVDGVSLAGVLQGSATARDTVYWHFPHYHGSGNRPSAALRAGQWKLVHWFEDGVSELYDLDADLSESQDLASEHPGLTASLAERLEVWLRGVDANYPAPLESGGVSPGGDR